MHSRFEMSLIGEMKFFLGLQIHQSPKGIFINQAKYALEILKKHNMDNCHSIGTPLATKPKLDVDLSGEPVDQSDYHSKSSPALYLTSSRPELSASKKHFLGDTVPCVKLVSWMSRNRIALLILQQRQLTCITKALPDESVKYLVRRIGNEILTPADLEVLTNETA
ncbi:retrovirus-related pol polyprotein from transposon TNT 1-94 [Tanacetum coccineum]